MIGLIFFEPALYILIYALYQSNHNRAANKSVNPGSNLIQNRFESEYEIII
jgi:hypothetical protein